MFRSCLRAATFGGVLALGLLVGQPAHAFITVTFNSITPLGGGIFRWNYTAAVDPGSQADPTGVGLTGPGAIAPGSPNPGDFWTMYDFLGYTGVSGVTSGNAADFTITSQVIGATPGFVTPGGNDQHFPPVLAADDPAITNVTFRKTGGPVVGPGLLATFFLDSTIGFGAPDNYSAGSHTNPADLSQSAVSAVERPTISAVPEPGTMALFGLGAAGLLLKLRRRRKTEK